MGVGARKAVPAAGPFGGSRPAAEPSRNRAPEAAQPHRGRRARSPLEIPRRGWKDILWRTYEEANRDRVMAVAAGVVFFALLALFPAVTALVSSYGLFTDMHTVGRHLEALGTLLPPGSFDIVREQIERITAKAAGTLTFAFVGGLAVALWSANAGMKAVFDALNVVYDEEEKRGFLALNAISLAFTLGAIVALLTAIAAVVALPLALSYLGLQGAGPTIISVLRWPVMFVLTVLGLAVLYRFGPSRRKPRWQWVSVGSVVAAFAWIVGSLAFSFYLSHFADYNATYGSLGAVIGLMVWMWLSVIVVLMGAELNAEMEHQTARDSTAEGEKPLGRRGARMADTVGPARA
ncbi:MAG: YihY/virulence factor BrkB family protein [Variibacter sp.]|nr:YihY/virulence factor BrkB family protein [Variibacter sp.]